MHHEELASYLVKLEGVTVYYIGKGSNPLAPAQVRQGMAQLPHGASGSLPQKPSPLLHPA